jgi:F-type H+-transporting ATPase subunit delta
MNDAYYDLARKYAIAFVNVYDQKIPESLYDEIKNLASELYQRKNLLISLTVPGISYETKYHALKRLLPASYFNSLIQLLLQDNRIIILPEVLDYIAQEYYKRHTIIVCTITSSHVLDQSAVDAIVHFLTVQTESVIKYTLIIDHNLIAGIRVQSDQFVWEYSIRKQLQCVKQMFA